jgi:hypothetical protein
MVAALTLLLIKPDIKDEVLASQARLGKLGLPVTKAALQEYSASSTTRRSHEVLRSIVAQFKPGQTPGAMEPLQQIDWEAALAKLRPLGSQADPLTIDDPADLMTGLTGFPGQATCKALFKEMVKKAFDSKTPEDQRVELLTVARQLMLNKGWNRSLVPQFVVAAMQAIYVKGATGFAKTNPTWFYKHKELAAPFPAPDFNAILKGEFVTTAYIVSGNFPLTDRKSFKRDFKPDWILMAFRNWEILYPSAKGVKSFLELQAALKECKPRLKAVPEDGEKVYFTIPLDADYKKVGENAAKRNAELAGLVKD